MQNILVAVDLSGISLDVIERADCFGQSLPVVLWLLHVVPAYNHLPPFNVDRDLWRKEIARGLHDRRRQLQELAATLREAHNRVRPRFIAGKVNTVILELASRIHADLIIMGSHGHGNVYRALFGGVGQRVMRKAPCPVMLVPPAQHSRERNVARHLAESRQHMHPQ